MKAARSINWSCAIEEVFGEAFDASGCSIGKGPAGKTVTGMKMAEGGKICFLLDPELIDQLIAALGRTRVKH
jgi:hypothetical protein